MKWCLPDRVSRLGCARYPNSFAFRDVLESLTEPSKYEPLAELQSRRDSVGESDGGIWKDVPKLISVIPRDWAGFGGSRPLTVLFLACKRSVRRRAISNSCPKPFFSRLLRSTGFGLSPLLPTPLWVLPKRGT